MDGQIQSVMIDNSTGTLCLNVTEIKPGFYRGQPDTERTTTVRLSPEDAERWGLALIKYGAIIGDRVAWETTERRAAGTVEPTGPAVTATTRDRTTHVFGATSQDMVNDYISDRGELFAVTWGDRFASNFGAILKPTRAAAAEFIDTIDRLHGVTEIKIHDPLES